MNDPPYLFLFGEFTLDTVTRELLRGGATVDVSVKPLQLLEYLIRNRDRTVPAEELIGHIWGDVAVSDASLATALRRVRRVLGEGHGRGSPIQTRRGIGYRFVGDVTQKLRRSSQPELGRTHDAPLSDPHAARVFVGRGTILGRLSQRLDGVQSGRGGAILIAGEPGIGKTRTAMEMRAIASTRGIDTALGRCPEGSDSPPYRPWSEILRAIIDGGPAAEWMTPERAAILTASMPDLETTIGAIPEAPPAPPGVARFRLYDTVAGLITAAARSRPQLFLFEYTIEFAMGNPGNFPFGALTGSFTGMDFVDAISASTPTPTSYGWELWSLTWEVDGTNPNLGADLSFYLQATDAFHTNSYFDGVGSLSSSGSGFTIDFTPVPEPSTALLLGIGLVAGLSTRRRRS